MWFLFGEVSSSSGCLGLATLFYCGTPGACHIIISYSSIVIHSPSVRSEILNKLFRPHMSVITFSILIKGERGGLVVNGSDSGSRGRGFEPHSGQTVFCP